MPVRGTVDDRRPWRPWRTTDAPGPARRVAADRGPGRQARTARPADGRHGHPGPRPGLAGADPAGRGRPRLRDPGQGPRRVLRPAGRARATRPTSATTRCSAASRPTSWTSRAAGRWTSWSTASRCATASSSATGWPSRPRRCPSPSSCCRSSRSSRSTARTCSTRCVLLAEHPLAQDDGAPDARLGQGAINVPRILSFTSNDWGWWRTVTGNLDTLDQYLAVELDARGPRPQQRPSRPVRAGRPGRRPADRHRRRPEVDPLEAPLAGRRAPGLVPGSRGDGAQLMRDLLRHRHPRLRGLLAQVPQRRRRSTRPTSWSWAAT